MQNQQISRIIADMKSGCSIGIRTQEAGTEKRQIG